MVIAAQTVHCAQDETQNGKRGKRHRGFKALPSL